MAASQWYGGTLGTQPEKYWRQAEMREKGGFEQVAKDLMSGGQVCAGAAGGEFQFQ